MTWTPSLADAAKPKQPSLLQLTSPKWRSVWTRLRRQAQRGGFPWRMLLLVIAGLLFLGVAFGISYRVLGYISDVPEIGALLASKMLGMALLAFTGILLLSNLIGSLSTFFLARDLDMLVAAPVEWGQFYLAKLGETVVHSSWMVA